MAKKYPKEDIFVVWDAAKCSHSGNCVKGLPSVFNVKASPWIEVKNADKDSIIKQVGKCPSGALSIEYVSPDDVS